MDNLNFVTKSRSSITSDMDVSVHRGNSSNKKEGPKVPSCNLTFRNNSADKISRTGYFVYAVSGAKLYFKECSEKDGYKLTKSHGRDDKNRYTTFSNSHKEIVEWCNKYDGEYNLEYDPKYNLWFINGDGLQFHFK